MDSVVIPRIEMAVRSLARSSVRGPNSMVQNPDQGSFSGKTENNPLMSASSRIDSKIGQRRNNETRNIENPENGVFPALRPNYDRQTHTHHMVVGHNAPQNNNPEIFTGHLFTQTTLCPSKLLNIKNWEHTNRPSIHCQCSNKQ